MARPDGSLWSHSTLNFSRPYFALTLSFNILTSALLVLRLLYLRKQVVSAIGLEHAKVYTTAAAIIVESTLPLGLYSLVLVIVYGIQDRDYTEDLLIVPLVHLEVMSYVLNNKLNLTVTIYRL